jgi:hypothetical protein
MNVQDDRDKDPNLDEYAYEHRVANPAGDASADEHADNPHPDADGDVTDDPAAVDDPTGVIDPKAD